MFLIDAELVFIFVSAFQMVNPVKAVLRYQDPPVIANRRHTLNTTSSDYEYPKSLRTNAGHERN